MSDNGLVSLNIGIRSLAVFRGLRNDAVIAALEDYLNALNEPTALAVEKYAAFVSLLYGSGSESVALADYVVKITGDDENIYIKTIGRGEVPSPEVSECVKAELQILQKICDLTPQALAKGIAWDGHLPSFKVSKVDLAAVYEDRCAHINELGYGMYARYHVFHINDEGHIVPVHNPDDIRLSMLINYKREQKIIMDNTLALLEGKPAANILLSGDAGTGKSSTVKAVVNELKDRGLRILEVRKEQLNVIPLVLDELYNNPLKFIIFIDDLSFAKDDDNFGAMKAVLEGSVSAKSGNVAIYVTSNRRHLVKETFSDRDGDDVHRNDTIQELASLSERFGIHILFQKPDKKTYLDIVGQIASEKGIDMPQEQLYLMAEQFALGRGGRSARAAKQFVDSLLSKHE